MTTPTPASTNQTGTPDGQVRLTDLLAIVARHAIDNDWCDDVEAELRTLTGVTFPTRPDGALCDCGLCRSEFAAQSRRFTLPAGAPEFVTAAALTKAVDRVEAEYDGDVVELLDEIRSTFGLAVDEGRTWTITITATDRDLSIGYHGDNRPTVEQIPGRVAEIARTRPWRSLTATVTEQAS